MCVFKFVQTREKQLRRAARELHRLQREREKMVEETVILETETQEMRSMEAGIANA